MTKILLSGFLTSRFAGSSQEKPQPRTKPTKKRTPPLSVRISDDERALLESWAGRMPLGTYVKKRLFDGVDIKPRKARQRSVVEEYDLLARLLGTLGRTDAFRNLGKLIALVENDRLDLDDDDLQTILGACACITAMRRDLVEALGLKEG